MCLGLCFSETTMKGVLMKINIIKIHLVSKHRSIGTPFKFKI